MNTDKLMELERKWRARAAKLRAAAEPLHAWDDPERTNLIDAAIHYEDRADELAALRAEQAVGTARQPENIGEFVIALLIAGGYVTQAKVDEARKIALGHGPYEMPARQSEGMVLVPREPTEAMLAELLKPYDRLGIDFMREKYAAMLAAAPGGEGEVGR